MPNHPAYFSNTFLLAASTLTILLLASACQKPHHLPPVPEGAEAISLLGDTLKPLDLPEETYQEYSENLEQAVANYRLDPEDPDAIIWLGRRLAYLGHYREAVQTFTEGIYKFPEDPRMYRHRGHRYITLRLFDQAIEDFETAVSLMRNQPDEVEPDGLPNPYGEPRSTLHTNVWYHLGLAHYLKGQYYEAAEAFQRCVEASTNDDMLTAALYWYYMAERRAGLDEQAGRLLDRVEPEMDILENDTYHKLLLVFKGYFHPDKLLGEADEALQNATAAYGVGNWHFINSREEEAFELWNNILEGGHWPAFGYLAAEAELYKLKADS